MKIEELRCDACGEPITTKQTWATVTIRDATGSHERHYHENDGRGCFRDLVRALRALERPRAG